MSEIPHKRLQAAERRDQLVGAAHHVLNEGGVSALRLATVAERAGVTRQFAYRFFAGPTALVEAVLDDFIARLSSGFEAASAQVLAESTFDSAAELFVEVVCDAIDSTGPGAWRLLATKDAEYGPIAYSRYGTLVEPWLGHIARVAGEPRDAHALTELLLATGRAAIDTWVDGEASREDAVRYARIGLAGVLSAFEQSRR
ncbi:MAG: AcrR family transcriptional regulator [Bradymonadia bacterium]|jgi:AcrR family transcriptional regulator